MITEQQIREILSRSQATYDEKVKIIVELANTKGKINAPNGYAIVYNGELYLPDLSDGFEVCASCDLIFACKFTNICEDWMKMNPDHPYNDRHLLHFKKA